MAIGAVAWNIPGSDEMAPTPGYYQAPGDSESRRRLRLGPRVNGRETRQSRHAGAGVSV